MAVHDVVLLAQVSCVHISSSDFSWHVWIAARDVFVPGS